PSLILAKLAPNGLSALLAGPGGFRSGEAVTIIAPLVDALSAVHRAGFTHGGINAASVLFDERGAPVLTGFGAAAQLKSPASAGESQPQEPRPQWGTGGVPPAVLEGRPEVERDLNDLLDLAGAVLARVTQPTELDDVRT